MPNPNVIVGLITRIDPPIGRPGVEMFRASPDGFLIQFDSDRSARLAPGDRAAGQLEILADLQRMQHPAYVEFDPDTRIIARLLIPLVAQIVGITPTADGVAVELEISHARHTLRRSNPDFEELLSTLREAQAKGGAWIITETDDHEIIDVRPFPGAREPLRLQPLGPDPPLVLVRLHLAEKGEPDVQSGERNKLQPAHDSGAMHSVSLSG
jgi:hypothetical protein